MLYLVSDARTRSRGNMVLPLTTVAGLTALTRTFGERETASSRTRCDSAALLARRRPHVVGDDTVCRRRKECGCIHENIDTAEGSNGGANGLAHGFTAADVHGCRGNEFSLRDLRELFRNTFRGLLVEVGDHHMGAASRNEVCDFASDPAATD